MADPCPNADCEEEVQLNEEKCPSCGCFAGYPNVRQALAERDVLLQRARLARVAAATRNATDAVLRLEGVAQAVRAVVNMQAALVLTLLTDGKSRYTDYASQSQAGTRRPAPPRHDAQRQAVEGRLFGTPGAAIVYAALSPDLRGLTSYGPVTVRLKTSAVAPRASLLGENSYGFDQRHPGPGPLPHGHRATWGDRGALAVAKLADGLAQATSTEDIAAMLLFSEGDRATDRFIEVHLWGGFNGNSVDGLGLPAQTAGPAPGALQTADVAALAAESDRLDHVRLRATADQSGLHYESL